jgi:hypothetical protein
VAIQESKNNQGYPYAWLDEVVEITLNPEKNNVSELKSSQLEQIEDRFDHELQLVLNDLKTSTFYLFSSKKIKATVYNYYESLMLLEHQAKNNLTLYPVDHPLLATGEHLIISTQNMAAVFKKRYGKYLTGTDKKEPFIPDKTSIIAKLLCKLSVDQIGIILKAADDSKIIIASSLSLIFRSIVPYLSTDKVKNPSWSSMRKSTYQMEQADKDIAIGALEKLILQIKEY